MGDQKEVLLLTTEGMLKLLKDFRLEIGPNFRVELTPSPSVNLEAFKRALQSGEFEAEANALFPYRFVFSVKTGEPDE
jgi:hypothetical protein